MGVDDISLAARSNPRLATISTPKREMARAATELLLLYIQYTDIPEKPLKILVSPHLVVRGSTARL